MSFVAELPGVYVDALYEDAPIGRLLLCNRYPEPGETAAPRDVVLRLMIADLGDTPSVALASVRVYVNGVEAFVAGAATAAFSDPRSGYTLGINAGTNIVAVTLARVQPYASTEQVTVRVLAESTDGAATLDETYSFTTADAAAPEVVAAQARSLRVVRVQFNEAVQQLDAAEPHDALNPANYVIVPLEVPAVTPAIASIESVSPAVVDVVAAVELSFGKLHQVQVVGVADVHGNVIAPPQNAVSFLAARPRVPPGRSFDLYRMLPKKNRREDTTGDLLRFIACIQDVTDLLLWDCDRFGDILDPDFADEQYLDLMLATLGNPFGFELAPIDKRRLLRVLVAIYRQKGTGRGITNAVRFFLGLECTPKPWVQDTWVLGESALGESSILGPSGSWALRAFDVEVTQVLTAEQRGRLRKLVRYMKPANTHFVDIIEPTTPELPDHVELGVSLLGESWVLH